MKSSDTKQIHGKLQQWSHAHTRLTQCTSAVYAIWWLRWRRIQRKLLNISA